MDTKRKIATLSFAVVDIPVGVLPVVRSTEKRVALKTLHTRKADGSECLTPIIKPSRCPACDVEVGSDETVSSFSRGGRLVIVTDAEKESVATVRNPVIEVTKFVTLSMLESSAVELGVESRHWLLPEDGKPTESYSTLYESMFASGVSGFGHSTLWGKQWPFMLSAVDGGLVVSKLWPARAVRGEFDVLLPPVQEKMMSLMDVLIGEYTGSLDESDFAAPEQDALRDLVEAKLAGESYQPVEQEVRHATEDLEAALKASIKQIQGSRKRKKAAA